MTPPGAGTPGDPGDAVILLDKGVITSAMFTALLLMAITSAMPTVPMGAPQLARS